MAPRQGILSFFQCLAQLLLIDGVLDLLRGSQFALEYADDTPIDDLTTLDYPPYICARLRYLALLIYDTDSATVGIRGRVRRGAVLVADPHHSHLVQHKTLLMI